MARQRTLLFQFITDTRRGGTEEQLQEMDQRLRELLQQVEGVELNAGKIYKIDWDQEDHPDGPHFQWRINYSLRKNSRKITWNNIYEIINKVYATKYTLV